MNRGKARKLREIIEQASASLPDETALEGVELFPAWNPNSVTYTKDHRVQYNARLYRVVQTHTSQADWPPDVTPALFTEVPKPGEIPVWRQPTGSQDAYNTGDRVHFPTASDPIYSSKIDNNVWSPTEYPAGWDLETT